MHNINFYYIVERDIFHIFTSEDIDHVTFSIYTIFSLGLCNKQNITRWFEDDFYLLVLKTIFFSLAVLIRKILFSPVISACGCVISSIYIA
jgi:Na+/H+ antiporter NhaB